MDRPTWANEERKEIQKKRATRWTETTLSNETLPNKLKKRGFGGRYKGGDFSARMLRHETGRFHPGKKDERKRCGCMKGRLQGQEPQKK